MVEVCMLHDSSMRKAVLRCIDTRLQPDVQGGLPVGLN